MKKHIVLAVLVAIGITFAQEQKAISLGIRAGLNLNSAKLIEGGKNETNLPSILDNHIGFHAGVIADIAINQFLYFQPGVMFSTKGGIISSEYEYEDSYNDPSGGSSYHYEYEKETFTTNVYCIELPIMLSLKAPLTEDLFLRANVGPYFDFGISGTLKHEYEYEYEYEYHSGTYNDNDNDSDKGSDSEDIYPKKKDRWINGKSLNVGIGVGGGFEFNSFYLGVNYYYGLTNVLDAKEDYYEAYDRTLSITLGYNF